MEAFDRLLAWSRKHYKFNISDGPHIFECEFCVTLSNGVRSVSRDMMDCGRWDYSNPENPEYIWASEDEVIDAVLTAWNEAPGDRYYKVYTKTEGFTKNDTIHSVKNHGPSLEVLVKAKNEIDASKIVSLCYPDSEEVFKNLSKAAYETNIPQP